VAEKLFDEVVTISCLPDHIYKDFVTQSRIIELDVFEERFKHGFRKERDKAFADKNNNFEFKIV
jgi:hypothetical protein